MRDRLLDLRRLRRTPAEERRERVADPADALLDGAEQLARAHEVLPAREHLAAQQRAVARRGVHGRRCLVVRALDDAAQARVRRRLRVGRTRHEDRPAHEVVHDPVARRGRDPLPLVAVRAERGEPRRHRGDRPLGEEAVDELGLPHDEERRGVEAVLVHHPAQVVRHGLGARVDPVEDHRDLRAALGGTVQEVPRDGVGVAGGRRDEQPQVGRGEELRGELAVRRLHGVDVGRVHEREALRQRVARDEAQRARRVGRRGGLAGPGPGTDAGRGAGRGAGCGARGRRPRAVLAHAREPGQHAVGREPALVERVVDEDGRARRRAQHAGRRDVLAEERVHERRLPRSGRPADDDEQRRRVRAQPGQQVVVELVDRQAEVLARERRAGQVEREPRGGEPPPQDLQRLDEPRGRRGARRDPTGARPVGVRAVGARAVGGRRVRTDRVVSEVTAGCHPVSLPECRWPGPMGHGRAVFGTPARSTRTGRDHPWEGRARPHEPVSRRVTPPGGPGATRPRPRPAPAGTRAGAGCPAAPGRART